MRKIASILIAALTILGIASCKKIKGDGPVVTETRSATGFSSITSGINADVYVRQEPDYGLEISAQQNILSIIQTRVYNGELNIDYEGNYKLGPHERISIYISAPNINALVNEGSGNISVDQKLRTNDLHLRISGSGSINLQEVIANNIHAKISGSGSMNAARGTAQSETMDLSGSGDADFLGVEASHVQTQTSGSGTTRVHATDHLDARISGSGDVIYKGHPQITTSISGSGKLQPW